MVAWSGWWHLQGSCTGANKAMQWQGISTLLGRKHSAKPSGKPQNRDPPLEAKATQTPSRSEGQVLAAALAQPQGMRQLPVPCGLWSHAEPWLGDTVARWGSCLSRQVTSASFFCLYHTIRLAESVALALSEWNLTRAGHALTVPGQDCYVQCLILVLVHFWQPHVGKKPLLQLNRTAKSHLPRA